MSSKPSIAAAKHSGGGGPALSNSLAIEYVAVSSLRSNPLSPRKFKAQEERAAEKVLAAQDIGLPLVVDGDDIVLVGELILRGARRLKRAYLPVIRLSHLSEVEAQALAVAYQRLAEMGEWDRDQLRTLSLRFEAEIPNYEPEHIGFEVGAMDIVIGEADADEPDAEVVDPLSSDIPISKLGDLWMLGKHRVICGDSTDSSTFSALMAGSKPASMVFSDPPFGPAINGFFSREGRHREFVQGSGDMSQDELLIFFKSFVAAMLSHLKNGAIVELVIDWRSLHLLLQAAEPLLGQLINLAVWVKDRRGQGSFLRSQHELILIFKAGKGRFRNNVDLGRYGRDRSNVWSYPSARTSSTGSDEGDMLKYHPTPKSVRMVADAILDCTRRGDVILDTFLGSGTTLIAAEKVARTCHAVELDPLYVDLAIRRWQAWTGEAAVHQASGQTFDEIAAGSEQQA